MLKIGTHSVCDATSWNWIILRSNYTGEKKVFNSLQQAFQINQAFIVVNTVWCCDWYWMLASVLTGTNMGVTAISHTDCVRTFKVRIHILTVTSVSMRIQF